MNSFAHEARRNLHWKMAIFTWKLTDWLIDWSHLFIYLFIYLTEWVEKKHLKSLVLYCCDWLVIEPPLRHWQEAKQYRPNHSPASPFFSAILSGSPICVLVSVRWPCWKRSTVCTIGPTQSWKTTMFTKSKPLRTSSWYTIYGTFFLQFLSLKLFLKYCQWSTLCLFLRRSLVGCPSGTTPGMSLSWRPWHYNWSWKSTWLKSRTRARPSWKFGSECILVRLEKNTNNFCTLFTVSRSLKIGFFTGPCVAGIVGLKMPRYCL